MSWVEDINTDFIIQTGDGKQFKPNWIAAMRGFEFNVVEYEYPNIEGTYVDRKLRKGARYPLTVFFQGDNCIDVANDFLNSARDTRPWLISHPLYGNLTVQPIRLFLDDSDFNVTKITGEVIETITETPLKLFVDPVEKITNDKATLDEVSVNAVKAKGLASDISKLIKSANALYSKGKAIIKVAEEAQKYLNLVNEANSLLLNIIGAPIAALRATQNLINYPAMITNSVKQRVDTLSDQFQILRTSINNITGNSGKQYYQHNATSMLSAICIAASTPSETPVDGELPDYSTRADVLDSAELLLTNYNQFLADMDSLQSVNGSDADSYIPDAATLIGLNDIVNYTISNLLSIATNSKQERSLILEDDSNIVVLTHRFYGLDDDDKNIETFINSNKIGLNEMLQVRKGRKLVYYV